MSKYTREQEAEANLFAAEFLMPEEEFREAAKTHKNIHILGPMFGVTPAAALNRCYYLGIEGIKTSFSSYGE